MQKERKGIDIIIPIYNAYDDLQKCYESIIKYTDLSLDRIIMINDNSTDDRIHEFLNGVQRSNVIYIKNEMNMGFSNNVNKGMQYSEDRDVLLLNSDTIVTKHWVDKIYNCAYSREEIGTVTPLSNSATLCSVPIMCQDNNIPEGLSVDDMAEIIERCSLRSYPRITVAVGFCMFIKRCTINDVGLFDAKTFERGYGEENDFCNRAEQLGYIHVMCDDAFIYHKGTVSFLSEEKQKLIESHDKILNERYPQQMRKNHLYCINNPDQYIRDNINIHIPLKNGKKNVLFLSHLDFREDANGNVGGTQFHVRDLTMKLRNRYNVFVMARDTKYLRLTIYTETEESFMFDINQANEYFQFRNKKYSNIFASVLDAFKIDIVHIHHVEGISFDLFYEAHKRNIPLYVTLHDYFYICPNVKLLNENNEYCAGKCDSNSSKRCLQCQKDIAKTVEYLKIWRRECLKVLEMADTIFAPSESARDIVSEIYPGLENNIVVIEHGTEISRYPQIESSSINIKYSEQVQGIIDKTEKLSDNVVKITGWMIFAGVDNRDVKIYAEIKSEKKIRYEYVSKYTRTDIVEYFNSYDYANSGVNYKYIRKESDNNNISIRLILEYEGEYYSNNSVTDIHFDDINKTLESKKKIAFIGGMVPSKGSELAYELITKMSREKYNWYIFGDIGDEKLSDLIQENYLKYGAYKVEELPDLIDFYKIDLICILPIWPETFCYTLSEAILCNVPVIGTDIGAVGARIKEHSYGWIIPYNAKIDEIIKKIDEILQDNNSDYMQKKKKAEDFVEISIEDMACRYTKTYDNCVRNINYNMADNQLILSGYRVENNFYMKNADELQKKLEKATEKEIEYQKSESELNEIKRSKAYRFMMKILHVIGKR